MLVGRAVGPETEHNLVKIYPDQCGLHVVTEKLNQSPEVLSEQIRQIEVIERLVTIPNSEAIQYGRGGDVDAS
jgi:hypothetical protein